ncbi:Partner of Y14 and mago [Cytospora mali]|uniref:Partner of Y14 and mago n=1 Tax=Cytospora mali TaxID=578113 RepID=A0A194VVC6_CYTMA|nr:Partner of Y14 and mago [Valsa mali]
MPSQPSNAGIVTDEDSGQRQIPESVRADGSTRKAIKIRPGYRPPEDVEVYKNRTAETFRSRYKGGVIGAEAAADPAETSAAANKNAKRREARKKAKAAETGENGDSKEAASAAAAAEEEEPVDSEVEREKKARNLKKKLKQARDLKDKKDGGQPLLPEQIAKVIKINELVRELAALGFDSEGEPVKKDGEGEGEEAKEEKAPA